jgi:PAS domain S-box-containing protein
MSSARILIVEDEPVVARDIAECLEGLGYVVLGPVASGEEAVAAAESEHPDAVLMDIRLRGEIDGIEAASQIQSFSSAAVVFLTAFVDRDLLMRAREVGVFGYLTKPYEERELFATLEMALAKSESEQARKQAEEALSRSEHRYRELVEGTADLITKVDGEGRFTFVNLTAERMLGVANVDCPGRSAFDFIHPDDRERTVEWFYDAIRQRLGEAAIENRQVNEATGELCFLLWTAAFHYDDDGSVVEVNSIAHDVTARKQADRDVRLHAAIMNNVAEGIHLIGLDDLTIRWTNERFTRMFGYEPGELDGKHVDVVNAPTDRTPAETRTSIVDILKENGEWHGEVRNIKRDGTHFWCYADVSLFDHPEYGKVFVSAHTDITARKLTEETLAEQERYYRTLIFSLHEDILVIDRDYVITDINNSALKTLGAKREDVIGRHCYEVSHGVGEPCDKHGEQCGLRTVFETGKFCHIRHEHVATDGIKVHVDLLMSPLKDANGVITHVVEAARDITNLIETEKELRHAEAFMHAVIDDMPAAVFAVEPPDGRLVLANSEAERIIGLSREQLNGLSAAHPEKIPWEIFYSDGTPRPVKELPIIKAVQSGEVARNEEMRICGADGIERALLCNATPVRNDDGDIIRAVSTILDITDRKRAEKKLDRTNRLLQASIAQMPIAYILWDKEFRVAEWNQAAEDIFGYTREEMLGEYPLDYIVPEPARPLVRDVIGKLLAGQEAGYSADGNNICKDGSVITCQWHNMPLKDDQGQVFAVLSMAVDITEQKRVLEERSTVLQTAMDGFWIVDSTGRLLDVNDAYCEMTGYTRDELLEMNISDVEDIESAEDTATHIQQIIADGSGRFETRHRCKDGRIIEMEVSSRYMADTKRFATFLHDITERKKNESDLKRQRYFLSRAQEIGAIGTWELDVAKNELLWTDENYRIFGLPLGKELTYDIFLNCVHPDDREYVDTKWKAAMAGEPYDIDHRLLVDGQIKWVNEKAELEFDDEGNCIRGTGFTQDITDRKRAEEVMREQLDELCRWRDVTLNREDRVQELKREINGLLTRLGESIRYGSQVTGGSETFASETGEHREDTQ